MKSYDYMVVKQVEMSIDAMLQSQIEKRLKSKISVLKQRGK